MRRITAHLFHSLDGVVSAPHLFQFDQFDDGCAAAMGAALASTDEVILGRVAYDEWADYWPTNTEDGFGEFINPIRKNVASRTLTGELAWQNSHLIEGDLLDFAAALREGEGADCTVAGISVIRQLLLAGLLDALTLTTHPVIAGEGQRLFLGDGPMTRLALLDSVVTEKGNIIATYGPRA